MPQKVASGSATVAEQRGQGHGLPVLIASMTHKKLYDARSNFFGAAWYPYSADGEAPVLALVGMDTILVVRLNKSNDLQIIRHFTEEDHNPESSDDLCTVAWGKRSPDGNPLLVVGGSREYIRVIDAMTGELVQTLVGHGQYINEIQTCPTDPSIIASCGDDQTIRVWSLREEHKKQPCMVICGGWGHENGLQHCSWHDSGRYLISGGNDYVVNVWVIPELPNENSGTDKPTIVYYPHFSSNNIHSHDVDCVYFLGDLILSKCMQEDCVIVWRILNFDSSLPPPPISAAEIRYGEEWKTTVSAWRRSDWQTADPSADINTSAFERLFRLNAPFQYIFYNRFGFSRSDNHDTILAVGSTTGHIYMWNLTELIAQSTDNTCTDVEAIRAFKCIPDRYRKDEVIPDENVTVNISDSFCRVEPHNTIYTKKKGQKTKSGAWLPWVNPNKDKRSFCVRGCEWSLGGDYLAVIGENGCLAIYGYPAEKKASAGEGGGSSGKKEKEKVEERSKGNAAGSSKSNNTQHQKQSEGDRTAGNKPIRDEYDMDIDD